MRRALAVLALVAASVAARAEDVAPEDRAFVEVVASKATCWEGETIELRLRIGYDAEFFRTHAVQRFQQPLDVPVNVETWQFYRPPDAGIVDRTPSDKVGLTFVLGYGLAKAVRAPDVTRAGRTFEVVEKTFAFAPARPGELTIPGPPLWFSWAARFDEDVLQGRVPVGVKEVRLQGAPIVIHVRPLPEEGRPSDFIGGVGRFTVSAEADRRDVSMGETFQLRLRFTRDGVFGLFDPFNLPKLPGFHVYRTFADLHGGVDFEIAALRDDLTEIPSISFAYFDPESGEYRVAKTEAIPLRVRRSATADAAPRPPVEDDAGRLPIAVAVVVAALAVVAVLVRRRTRGRDAVESHGKHVRDAAAAFRARAGTSDAEAFAAFLAACLDCPPAAVVSPDLAARLVAAGAPPEVAARAASLLERLVAARYGGEPSTDDASAARAVVEEIESALATASR